MNKGEQRIESSIWIYEAIACATNQSSFCSKLSQSIYLSMNSDLALPVVVRITRNTC